MRDDRLNIRELGAEMVNEAQFISDTVIFRCIKGSATISLNGNLHKFVAKTNFVIIDSLRLSVEECSDDFRCVQIIFATKTFNRIYTHIDTSIIDSLRYSSPDICPIEDYYQSELTLEKIVLLNNSDIESRRLLMRNMIFSYIFETYELVKSGLKNQTDSNSSFVNSLVGRFLILCRDNHMYHREISFYSDKLSISRRYLHTVVISKLQVSPKKIIDGYVISSAKRLLLNSTKTSLQIAEELNFPDQSTFGQFFKRIVGVSPSEFQKRGIY